MPAATGASNRAVSCDRLKVSRSRFNLSFGSDDGYAIALTKVSYSSTCAFGKASISLAMGNATCGLDCSDNILAVILGCRGGEVRFSFAGRE